MPRASLSFIPNPWTLGFSVPQVQAAVGAKPSVWRQSIPFAMRFRWPILDYIRLGFMSSEFRNTFVHVRISWSTAGVDKDCTSMRLAGSRLQGFLDILGPHEKTTKFVGAS